VRYLLAVCLPPAAVLLCRQPGQAVVNVFLTACFWVPGAAHALLVTRATAHRERADRLAAAVLAHEERLVRERRQARHARGLPHLPPAPLVRARA
jgi:uncharacterized membrane protein YqaE (UPF0057 family)